MGDIVMASDTLVTTGNIKIHQTKMMTSSAVQASATGVIQLPGYCDVVGAGNFGYMEACRERLLATHDKYRGANEDLQPKFEECLKIFYADHVLPFAVLPEEDRPDVELFIGAQHHGLNYLYVTHLSTVRTVMSMYATIGSGGTFAEALLSRIWRTSDIKNLQVLAAYVMFRVKESVEGCGGTTHIVTLNSPTQHQGGSLVHLPLEYIEDLEQRFRTTWLQRERNLTWELIENTPAP